MSNKPPISWSAALRSLKDDRAKPSPVREERLRSTAGLRGSPALALSAWRGKSGRRYVVGVHDPHSGLAAEIGEAVCLAVCRAEAGLAVRLDAAAFEKNDRTLASWIHRSVARGASEIHVHRLAESEAERRAIVADLDVPPAPAPDDASSDIDHSVEV